ncbi:MAG: response regulator transcription factor, partial [Thermoguttaceae bacterium]
PQFQKIYHKLTIREQEVLRFLAQGKSNKEIAAQLNVTADTIKEHLIRIFRKIDAHDRTQAAVWAVRKGLV